MKVNWRKLRKQIPARIQVKKNVYYDILWSKDLKDCVARMDPQKRQITILLGQSDKNTVISYLHELVHLFSDEYQFSLTETQVLSSEKCLYFVLKAGNLFK